MNNSDHHVRVRNSPAEVYSEDKVALIIGNGAYQEAPLRNPMNDAADTAAVLQKLDFQVQLLRDADIRAMKEAVAEFGRKLLRSGVGLFYFAGHGLQINGRNYIIPIGADIQKEQDVEFESVDVGRILGEMEHAQSQLNVFILDACRNNPFARNFRSPTRGLAQMVAPNETLIAYATSPGEVAEDGGGKNSPYTEALLQVFPIPGLDILDIFRRTAALVKEKTAGRQRPWIASDVTQQFYFLPMAAKEPIAPLVATPPFVHEEKQKIQPEKKRKAEVVLRSQPLNGLTEDEVEKTLVDKGLFDSFLNESVNGIKHQYRARIRHGEALVIDDATGLMWEQSGSSDELLYAKAEEYVKKLNNERFADYSDWRLPTQEEAMSLMEPTTKNGDLCIDPVFDKIQPWIWTADKYSAGVAWYVSFRGGYCSDNNYTDDYYYVRAVRTGQSSTI